MEIDFYCSSSGKNYVREFVEKQAPKAIKSIYRQIDRASRYELRFLVHAGVIKKLRGFDIWEIVVDFGKVFYRIFCVIRNSVLYLIHGFKKKSNKTPFKEIKTTLNRIRYLDRKLGWAVN